MAFSFFERWSAEYELNNTFDDKRASGLDGLKTESKRFFPSNSLLRSSHGRYQLPLSGWAEHPDHPQKE